MADQPRMIRSGEERKPGGEESKNKGKKKEAKMKKNKEEKKKKGRWKSSLQRKNRSQWRYEERDSGYGITLSADKEKLVKLIRGEKKKKGKKSFSIRTEIRFERIVPVGKSRFSLNGEHRRRSGTGERNFAPTTKEISVTRFGRHERLFQTLQQARVYIPSFHRVTKHEFPHLSFPPPPPRRSLTSRRTAE